MASKFDKFSIQMDSISDTDGGISEKIRGKPFDAANLSFFNVGRHQAVEITEVEDGGACLADPSWFKVKITFVSGKKSINTILNFPTAKLTYLNKEGKESIVPWQKLQEFMFALGVELTNKNAGQIIPVVFGNIDRLVGMKVDIIVGHDTNYAHYVGKDKYHIYDMFNKPILGKDNTNPIDFVSREAVEAYCLDQLKLPYSKYTSVRKIYSSKANEKKLNLEPEKKKTVSIDW